MSFYFGITHEDIAEQIAGLINHYNKLSTKRSKSDILSDKINYVVETHGKQVIAACGLEKQSYTLTELKHLVVREEWRRKGVGKFVVKRALAICDTPIAYATVREDNTSSQNLLTSVDFQRAGEYLAGEHRVIMLARTTPRWQKTPGWKPKSYPVPMSMMQPPGYTPES